MDVCGSETVLTDTSLRKTTPQQAVGDADVSAAVGQTSELRELLSERHTNKPFLVLIRVGKRNSPKPPINRRLAVRQYVLGFAPVHQKI